MTSEDWKTVLLAAITALGTFGGALLVLYGEILRRKANENSTKMDTAADKATVAAETAAETSKMVNGRMDDWKDSMLKEVEARVRRAYADGTVDGHRNGVASAVQAIAADPKIPLDQKAAMDAVVKAVQAPPS